MINIFYIKENQHFDGKLTYIPKFYDVETMEAVDVESLLNKGQGLIINPANTDQKLFAKKKLKDKVSFWKHLHSGSNVK